MFDFLRDDFIIRAALAGIGVSLVAAPLGCFIVWRRMAYFGATIAHSGLLGVALGFLLSIDLTFGVLAVSFALSAFLLLLERQRHLPSDTSLGILAHVTLAAGLIAASSLEGKRLDLMGYLFGDILAISITDLIWIYCGGALILAMTCKLWRPLLAICIQEDVAAAEGVHTKLAHLGFIILIAFTIAVSMKIVGILLITSLLIIPAATARPFAQTPEQMALIAALLAALGVIFGLLLSLQLNTPTGPSIVITLAALFAVSLLPFLRSNP